jgi:Domain of unknown function (DUF4832)/Domain of unknown function (DUF4874)/Secretion system C-terminal sorting domain
MFCVFNLFMFALKNIKINLPKPKPFQMKKNITLLLFIVYVTINAQTSTVTYVPSTGVFSNPERGFFKHSSAHAGTYNPLDQSFITDFRLNDNITLLYRNFRLNDFINSTISDSYLTNMQNDFNKLRNAGLKCIIRFTYSDDDTLAQTDATKATMLSHILQLKPLLIANSDIIAVIQAGFIGAWGEWYSTSQAEFGGYGYNQTDLTSTNIQHRKDILNAILSALPSNRSVQVRYPAFKRDAYSTAPLTSFPTSGPLARIGHHNDCFLANDTDYGTYDNTSIEYPYLDQDTKFVPMGGETCLLNSPRSDCSTAEFEMKKFHWSFLNADYYPDVITAFQTDNCYSDIQKKLGYRFEFTSATFPQAISIGSLLPVTIKLKNQGYAAPFNERKVYLILKNITTNEIFSALINSDPRTWLGPNEITITQNIILPTNLKRGSYKLYLSLPDSAPSIANRPEYAIRFANENVWESTTGYNNLNFTLNVTQALGIGDNSKLNMTIYPVPANKELAIELENINEYKITIYNSIGQNIEVNTENSELNKMTLNTTSMSDGLYFIEFLKGTTRDVRKIIIEH